VHGARAEAAADRRPPGIWKIFITTAPTEFGIPVGKFNKRIADGVRKVEADRRALQARRRIKGRKIQTLSVNI